MSLVLLAVTVFAVQGLLMLIDEMRFHRRREIPRWEVIGHPLDTLSVLIPLILTLSVPARHPWTGLFVALAVASCLFVTKDEWVHARLATPGEHWLHALLFMLHPLVFIALWVLWARGETRWIALQTAVVAGFLVWELAAWRRLWVRR